MSAEPPSNAPVRIVIDANALIALMAREPESEAVTSHIFGWVSEGVELHAPELDAELWTLDGPLARNASSRGLPVSLIDSQR